MATRPDTVPQSFGPEFDDPLMEQLAEEFRDKINGLAEETRAYDGFIPDDDDSWHHLDNAARRFLLVDGRERLVGGSSSHNLTTEQLKTIVRVLDCVFIDVILVECPLDELLTTMINELQVLGTKVQTSKRDYEITVLAYKIWLVKDMCYS
jgi:hypothetical protein